MWKSSNLLEISSTNCHDTTTNVKKCCHSSRLTVLEKKKWTCYLVTDTGYIILKQVWNLLQAVQNHFSAIFTHRHIKKKYVAYSTSCGHVTWKSTATYFMFCRNVAILTYFQWAWDAQSEAKEEQEKGARSRRKVLHRCVDVVRSLLVRKTSLMNIAAGEINPLSRLPPQTPNADVDGTNQW